MGNQQTSFSSADLKTQADRLMADNSLAEARDFYARALAAAGTDVESCVKLSMVERQLGNLVAAAKHGRRAVKLAPEIFLAHHALGLALHAAGQTDEAIGCYATAINLQPKFPDAHYLLGNALHQSGRPAEAVPALQNAISLRPNYFEAIAELAAVLILLGLRHEAEPLFQAALKINPESPEVLANLGTLHEQAGQTDQAQELYRRASQIAPARIDIAVKLAGLLERQNRGDEARALLSGIAGVENSPEAMLVLARAARQDGRLEEAVSLLNKAAAHTTSQIVAGEIDILKGQLLDRLDKPNLAFPHFVSGNGKIAAALRIDLTAPPSYLREIDRARSFLSAIPGSRSEMRGDDIAPVFLVGFPRSGTTLLEQVLDSHPQIQSMDEKLAVAPVRERFLELAGAENIDLVTLSPAHIAELRTIYFQAVDGFIKRRPGAILIDKLPLNMVWAHLIWRVFPEAKFILALRHPLDVCLSCFMQNFAINDAMASFLSLKNTALTYDAVMSLWRAQTALPLAYHPVRYEDLVADLPAQASAMLKFLGLPWNDSVLDHRAAVSDKKIITTASYHQVARPIYRESAFRWKRYEQYLGEIEDTLRPHIDAFGY